MEFSAYAAKETSALIARVATELSQASQQRVDALRAALETASKALEATLAAAPDTETEVNDLAARLTKAATAEGDARLKRLSSEARKITETLRADLEEQTREKEELTAALAEAQATAEGARAKLELAQQEAEQVRRDLTEAVAARQKVEAAQQTLETAQQKLEAARAEALAASGDQAAARARAEADLLDARQQLETARADVARTQAAAEEDARARAASEAELARARAASEAELQTLASQVEATRAEAAKALAAGKQEAGTRANMEMEMQALRDHLDVARAEITRTATLLRGTAEEKEKLEEALTAAKSVAEAAEGKVSAAVTRLKTTTARLQTLERERDESASVLTDLEERARAAESDGGPGAALPLMDTLLRGLEALAGAGTIDDVLTTLIEQLAGEFARVALFRVKGNRLEGAHQIGFALNNDIRKVMMPLAMDSVLTRAVTSGHTERVSGDDLLTASGLPFGGSPAWALAAPIVVDGESVAVIYADDSGQSKPDRHPAADDLSVKFAEAMRQHAIVLLTRLTREQEGQAQLRAYAGSLFDEIQQMYQADVAEGKKGKELQTRLSANIDYARSIFAHRTAYEPPAAARLLEAQLAGMIDLHRESAFGRDLATVSGWVDGKAAPRAASAS